MEQMMKTLFLGAIILLLPNLLDACTSWTDREKCEIACKNEFLDPGHMFNHGDTCRSNNPRFKKCKACIEKCDDDFSRYVYIKI